MYDTDVSHTPEQTHIETTAFLFMPGEVLRRRLAAPLC